MPIPENAIPDDVERCLTRLRDYDSGGYLPTLEKLVVPGSKDCAQMWNALRRRSETYDDLWIIAFVEVVKHAATIPDYHYLTPGKQQDLVKKIKKSAEHFVGLLKGNELDCHLIWIDEKMFPGLYIAEDHNDPEEARRAAKYEVLVSSLIRRLAERAEKEITSTSVKQEGKNVRAVKFARLLIERNVERYGTPAQPGNCDRHKFDVWHALHRARNEQAAIAVTLALWRFIDATLPGGNEPPKLIPLC